MKMRKLNEMYQLAWMLGKVSAVVVDGFLYRLILAVELGVSFLLLSYLFSHAVRRGCLLRLTSNESPAFWLRACNRSCSQLQSFEFDTWM